MLANNYSTSQRNYPQGDKPAQDAVELIQIRVSLLVVHALNFD